MRETGHVIQSDLDKFELGVLGQIAQDYPSVTIKGFIKDHNNKTPLSRKEWKKK